MSPLDTAILLDTVIVVLAVLALLLLLVPTRQKPQVRITPLDDAKLDDALSALRYSREQDLSRVVKLSERRELR